MLMVLMNSGVLTVVACYHNPTTGVGLISKASESTTWGVGQVPSRWRSLHVVVSYP